MKVRISATPSSRVSTLKGAGGRSIEILHSHGGSAFHWPYSVHRDDAGAHAAEKKVEFIGEGWTPELKALYPKLLAGTVRPFTNGPSAKSVKAKAAVAKAEAAKAARAAKKASKVKVAAPAA